MAAKLLLILFVLAQINASNQSQGEILTQIQRLLSNPAALSSWNESTDVCNLQPSSSLTILCYQQQLTHLHVIGNSTHILPKSFSIDSLFATLAYFGELKALTLHSLGLHGEIGGLTQLRKLEILNMSANFLTGQFPSDVSSMKTLQRLALDDNWLNGSLPGSLSELKNLRTISLSGNLFEGEVPSLSKLRHLEVLDLEGNAFGPKFASIGSNIVTLKLGSNNFRDSLTKDLSGYLHLRWIDVSNNSFVGPFNMGLLSLPALEYMNISNNKLSGRLLRNQTCGRRIKSVDVSENYLTGELPECLSYGGEKKVLFSGNCFQFQQNQQPVYFCSNEALAVGMNSLKENKRNSARTKLALDIVAGGIAGGVAVIACLFYAYRRVRLKSNIDSEKVSFGYTPKAFLEARYISQSKKLEPLGVQPYRAFTVQELEEATNNFESSGLIQKETHEEMYKGRLQDGSLIAVRCINLRRNQSTQSVLHYVEHISKLRHRNVESAIGHCFDDDSNERRLYLVFEFAGYSDLRSWVSEGRTSDKKLNWGQRISAAIGVAKGLQFLHTGIVPGIYSNTLRITDVLVDQDLTTKISCFNLPFLAEYVKKIGSENASNAYREIHGEKSDVYDFGVILLEILLGKEINSEEDVRLMKNELQESISGSQSYRRRSVDECIGKNHSDKSLATVMEICGKCLLEVAESRPSVEDVLWNLQFAAQIEDAREGRTSRDYEASPAATPTRRDQNVKFSL